MTVLEALVSKLYPGVGNERWQLSLWMDSVSSFFATPGHPPLDWLIKQVAVESAEAELRDEARAMDLQISDDWLRQWKQLLALLGPSDELWYFEHFPEPFTGAAGYCILRNGDSIASITTKKA